MPGKVSKNMGLAAGIIGCILLGSGLGCAVAGFVWTAYGEGAHGIWSGLFMIVTGTFGCVVLCTKHKAIMIVFLVFCIIDLIINIIQAIVAAIVAALVGILKDALDDDKCTTVRDKCYCYITDSTSDIQNASFEIDNCDDINAMIAILRAVTAFSVIGIFATFTGSIIGCIGACCDKGEDQPGVVVIQQSQQPQLQTTTVQTFHQPPPPNQQYPQQQYPQQQYPQQPYPQQPVGNDPEVGHYNGGY